MMTTYYNNEVMRYRKNCIHKTHINPTLEKVPLFVNSDKVIIDISYVHINV
jgi:hypothetical protein